MTGDSTQSKWNMTMNGLHGGGVTGLVSTQPNQPSVHQCMCLMLCGRGVGWDYLEDALSFLAPSSLIVLGVVAAAVAVAVA
eukprot:2060160-Pleurochrysis_carterae.AAC.1